MRTGSGRGSAGRKILTSLIALLFCGCSGPTKEASPAVDLNPFRDAARSSDCTDIQNRLLLIDGTFVLWDRKGNCPDASYLVRLNGGTVENVLCELRDSIAGPVKECRDARYTEMFDTITANLDKPDLGLGSGHTVVPIELEGMSQ